MLPFIIGCGTFFSGFLGLGAFFSACDTNARARDLCKEAQDKLKSAELEFEGKKTEFNHKVDSFNSYINSLQSHLSSLFSSAINQIASNEQLKNKFVAINMGAYEYMQTNHNFKLNSAVFSAVKSLALGYVGASVTPKVIMAIATAFGRSSTGVAISSLSGIAARNAALSWLGGGALSAGGMGIAGGLQMLNIASLGIGVLITGLVMDADASENYAKAQKFSSEVDLHVQKLKDEVLKLDTYISKIDNIRAYAQRLDNLIFDYLMSVNFNNLRSEHEVKKVYKAMLLFTCLGQLVNLDIRDFNLEMINKFCEGKLSEVQALVDKI